MRLKAFCTAILSITVIGLLCSTAYGRAENTEDRDRLNVGVVETAGRVDKNEWVTEKTGAFIPLDAIFLDEEGNKVRLAELIRGPTLLLPIYFYCPNSCSLNLANLAAALNRLNFEPGKDYRVIALSFNHEEKTDDARRAKNNYLKLVAADFPAAEWKFLTGESEAIAAVTGAMGFRFKPLDDGTFIHASTLVVLDSEGRIIRYVYGTFLPGDIDMAISAAKAKTPTMSVKRLLEFCFNYDPKTNQSLFQWVKITVLFLFTLIVGLIVFYLGRKRQGRRSVAARDDGNAKEEK